MDCYGKLVFETISQIEKKSVLLRFQFSRLDLGICNFKVLSVHISSKKFHLNTFSYVILYFSRN